MYKLISLTGDGAAVFQHYLYEWVPVGDGLAWVRQHLIPVISAQALGHAPHPTHTNNLIVADAVDGRRGTCLLKDSTHYFRPEK